MEALGEEIRRRRQEEELRQQEEEKRREEEENGGWSPRRERWEAAMELQVTILFLTLVILDPGAGEAGPDGPRDVAGKQLV